MSERPRTTTTTEGDGAEYRIPTVPDHAPDYAERTDDFSEKSEKGGRRWLRNTIALGAAGATLAAGIFVGAKVFGGNEGPSKEGQRPVATAPANPGQTHEATPSASTSETNPDSWTAENLPLSIDIDGNGSVENFTGKEQLVKALSLEVAKYPTPEAASKALLERFNTIVSWGTNTEADAKYDGYSSADHQRVGVGAAKQDVLLPAFQEALVGTPADGAQVMELPDNWASWVNDTAQEVNHRWIITKDQAHPYKYSCAADTSKANGGIVFNSGDEATHLKHGTIFVKCTDNLDQTDLGSRQMADGTQGYNSLKSKQSWFVDLQQQDGKWVVIGMQAEEALQ